MIAVEVVETTDLGDRSYVVHDGERALVVDPQRDLDRVEEVLTAAGVRCVLVAETHIHNDYVTGGYALAQRHGAGYLVAAAERVGFAHDPVQDGDERFAGALSVRVIATPGHTATHLSYLVDDGAGRQAVFTGGSLLFGSVGRTDLVDPASTDELTHAQYRSAQLLGRLPTGTTVHPTHGFGSFCSTGTPVGGAESTIGVERSRNEALLEPDEDTFVARLIAELGPYPAYYVHMGPKNRLGPAAADLAPLGRVGPVELQRRIAAGEWVLDLRDRAEFAAEHLRGTVGIPLESQFTTYVGWLLPWGTPLTLLGATAGQIAEAQRRLSRIGIDRPAGAAVGPPATFGETGSYPRATFDALAATRDPVLDVRLPVERAGGAIPGSVHVPLPELPARLDELPRERLWVHCAGGFRAGVAASLLARDGREVVLVDDSWPPAGMPG